jgi:hypothetical protein
MWHLKNINNNKMISMWAINKIFICPIILILSLSIYMEEFDAFAHDRCRVKMDLPW